MALCDLLEPIYLESMAHEQMAALLEIQLGDVSNARTRIELSLRLGRLLRDQLTDLDSAIDHFATAVLHDIADESNRHEFETLADVVGDWELVLDLYQKAVANCDDDVTVREVQRRIGQIAEELGRPDDARIAYRTVLEHDDTDREVLDRLETIYKSTADWVELVPILRIKSELEVGDDRVLVL